MQNEEPVDILDSEHWELLSKLFSKINKNEVVRILDAGSGRTSLSCLLRFFDKATVDAIVFPGDQRKLDSIMDNVVSDRYNLLQLDICKESIDTKYDLVLAHLLLGEATKWGNNFRDLLDKLLNIDSRYFVIFDITEDPAVDYGYIIEYVAQNGMTIIAQNKIAKTEPQVFGNFVAKNYFGLLIKR